MATTKNRLKNEVYVALRAQVLKLCQSHTPAPPTFSIFSLQTANFVGRM